MRLAFFNEKKILNQKTKIDNCFVFFATPQSPSNSPDILENTVVRQSRQCPVDTDVTGARFSQAKQAAVDAE